MNTMSSGGPPPGYDLNVNIVQIGRTIAWVMWGSGVALARRGGIEFQIQSSLVNTDIQLGGQSEIATIARWRGGAGSGVYLRFGSVVFGISRPPPKSSSAG